MILRLLDQKIRRGPSVVTPGLAPGIHVLSAKRQYVDSRAEASHDGERVTFNHGAIEIGEKSTNQLFGCTNPLIFALMARGATSWAT